MAHGWTDRYYILHVSLTSIPIMTKADHDASCMAVLNILHLLFTMLSIARKTGQVGSLITTFTEPITAILVSRCMLNLQAAYRKTMHVDSQFSTFGGNFGASDTLVLRRVIGSLGAPVIDDTHTEEDEEKTSTVMASKCRRPAPE
ncbi:hypothetical protein C8Q76DRAFT_82093 [Earliella scabrosa]|nr:hypothetical protein C8Q76DRAFT_82093 [Earliella scabrosa]